MRIATWNVNSVRARLERLSAWLEEARPDVLCLQETKCTDETFPRLALEELGYHVTAHGQRTYNGVAILSRQPLEDPLRGFGRQPHDSEARILGGTVGDVMLLCVYAVNGVKVGHPRYAWKLEWYQALRELVADRFPMDEKVVVCGDLNVTIDDRDVHDPARWREKILCSSAERRALAGLMDLGLADALRKFSEEGGVYTWWDYRTRAFERGNRGLRIDHVLLSPPALEAATGYEVDARERGRPRPSDHAPVVATLA